MVDSLVTGMALKDCSKAGEMGWRFHLEDGSVCEVWRHTDGLMGRSGLLVFGWKDVEDCASRIEERDRAVISSLALHGDVNVIKQSEKETDLP